MAQRVSGGNFRHENRYGTVFHNAQISNHVILYFKCTTLLVPLDVCVISIHPPESTM